MNVPGCHASLIVAIFEDLCPRIRIESPAELLPPESFHIQWPPLTPLAVIIS